MTNFSYYKMKLLTCHFVQGTAFPLSMFYHPCSENVEHLKKKENIKWDCEWNTVKPSKQRRKRDGGKVRITEVSVLWRYELYEAWYIWDRDSCPK